MIKMTTNQIIFDSKNLPVDISKVQWVSADEAEKRIVELEAALAKRDLHLCALEMNAKLIKERDEARAEINKAISRNVAIRLELEIIIKERDELAAKIDAVKKTLEIRNVSSGAVRLD